MNGFLLFWFQAKIIKSQNVFYWIKSKSDFLFYVLLQKLVASFNFDSQHSLNKRARVYLMDSSPRSNCVQSSVLCTLDRPFRGPLRVNKHDWCLRHPYVALIHLRMNRSAVVRTYIRRIVHMYTYQFNRLVHTRTWIAIRLF